MKKIKSIIMLTISNNKTLFYIMKYYRRNKKILNNFHRKTERNVVNLHWWSTLDKKNFENIGDYLSLIVCEYMLTKKNLSFKDNVGKTKHLYGIGSIIQAGAQDATIWGSGLKNGNKELCYLSNKTRKLDIKLVRGPLTRKILSENGYKCSEKYGDPALLMPLIYKPKIEKTKDYLVILHHESILNISSYLSTITNDYKCFINELCSSRLIISSSLHGIILAEAYGIPAILLKDKASNNLFKYEDYYNSTGRKKFPIADTVEDALKLVPPPIPCFESLQKNILESFPYELWNV